MAIAIVFSVEGDEATMANYFESIKRLGTTPEGPHPDPSCLFHWVTEDPNGYTVTDVWTDKASFEKFVEERVMPVTDEIGVPKPQIKYVDVANYCTAKVPSLV
jgi:hypothetical protein